MATGGQIRYGVGFNIDKTGLNELTKILQNVQQELNKTSNTNVDKSLKDGVKAAQQLESILNDAWNSKLNQLDLNKVNTGIKSTFGSVQQLKNEMEKGGATGSAAYNKIASSVLNTNLQLKQSNKLLDDMADTMAKTVKWGITSSIFNRITGSIQEAWGYTKRLDNSLNDIRIVTEKSAEAMQQFAREANNAAKSLGASTTDYTEASLIYFQQGLSDEEVAARAQTTIKAANVTGQSAEEVSEQLTAVWNGYKASAQEAELYVDKLAAVAASTAADLEELSTGMSKVASAANSMGVDIDQLNAQLATIVSVTRQAPESVGTALKTIYARLGDLAVDGEDEFGVALGTVSKTMEEMGIQILDEQGQMREMGEVIEETATKWDTWTEAQRQAAAVAIAGKRQYNNLVALFENWDMYTDALNTSVDATGTLQKQQDIYMESMEAHLQELSTEAEKTYDVLFNEEVIKGFIGTATGVLSIFNNFIEGIGGGGQAILTLGSLVANVFNKQIGSAINTQLDNLQKFRESQDSAQLKQSIIDAHDREGEKIKNDAALDAEVEVAKQLLSIKDYISQEEYNELTAIQKQIGLDAEKLDNAENYTKYLTDFEGLEKRSLDTLKSRLRFEKESSENNHQQLIAYEQIAMTLDDIEEGSTAQRELAFAIAEHEENINQLINEQYLDIESADVLYNKLVNESLERKDVEEILQKILNAQNKALNQSEKNVENLTDAVRNRTFLESDEYKNLLSQQKARKKLIAQAKEQAETEKQIQGAIQGITTIITLSSSLIGIIRTLNNEELSFEEKMQQVFTVTLSMLPAVIQNYSSFSQIIPGLTKGILKFAGGMGATTTGVTSLTGAIGTLWGVLTPFLPIILGVTLAVGALGVTIWACTEAYNADAKAAEKAAKVSKEAANAANEAKEAYDNLASSFDAYDKAVNTFEELAKDTEKLSENTEEYENALKSANEQAMELIKNNKNLAKYATRNEEGLITFKGADAEIAAARAKANLASGAANLSQVTANKAQLKSDYTDFQRIVENADIANPYISEEQISTLVNHINANNGGITSEDIHKLVGKFTDDILQQETLISALEKTTPELLKLAEETHNLNETNKLLIDDALRTGLSVNKDYATMNATQQNAVATLYAQGLTEEQKDEIRKDAEKTIKKKYVNKYFGDKKEDALHQDYAAIRGWTVADNQWGNKTVYIDKEGNEHPINDDSARAYLTELEAEKRMAEYDQNSLDTIMSAVTKVSEGGATFDENIASELLGFATKEDTKFDSSKLSLSMFDKLKENGNLEKTLSGLSSEEWSELGYKNATEFATAVRETLTDELRAAVENSTREALGALSDSANTLVAEMLEGKLDIAALGESEEYKSIIARLEDIKELYPELTEEAETFANESLLGTQMWSESLYKLKDAMDDISREELAENFENAFSNVFGKTDVYKYKVEAWLDSKNFETDLDSILDADYAINIEIHSQAEEAFEATSKAIENIKAEASKIGESYIVAAEDIRELNNVFPGILQNAIDLRNGTIQLNEDVVKSAIITAQGEVIADTEKTNEKLENAATELRAKQANYQAIANAAEALATGEMEADKSAADYEEIIQNGLNTMREESNNAELDDQELIATNAGDNAAIMADNWGRAYEQAALMAKQFADDAVAAAKVAQAGAGSVKIGDYNVNYKGRTGESAEATQLDEYQTLADADNSESYAKLRDAFQAAADAAGKQANDIEGMMIESVAILQDFTFGSLGIATGEGFKEAEDAVDKTNKKEAETAELLEDVYDRYREINIQLSLLETNLGRVQKQEEKLAGKAYIDNLQQQLEILDKQVEANKEKLSLTQQETQELMDTLSQYGAQFNEAGQVINHREVMDSALANANAIINTYNSMSAEEQEIYKATMEAAIASYEALDETFQRFDELYTEEIPGLVDTIQEELDQAIELKIEQFNTEIQIDLDLKDAERQWNDFYAEIVKGLKEDDLVGQSELSVTQLGTYASKDGNDSSLTLNKDLEKLAFLNSQANQIISGGWSDTYGDNIAALLEDLNKANDQLITDMTAAKELADGVYDNYLTSIDKVIEGNDDVIGQFEFLGELLDHNQKLIGILGANNKASDLTEYYAEKNDLNQQIIARHAENAKYYQQMMDSIGDKTSEEWQKWSEAWQEEVSNLNAAIIQGMEDAAAAYANTIELAIQEMESAFTDGLGFEYIQDEWDLTNENAEKYLDTINSAYEISKLENKFVDAINNTSSLSAQKKLTAAMREEIKLLENADKISQYDIDRANLKYELTLKQIALEEAQANKTSMRLQRDSQGNYGYVFAADQDEIAKAQEELANAENELYNFDKEAYNKKIESVLKAEQDLQSKLQEIWTNESLSEEQKLQYATMINEQYRDIIEADVAESEKMKENLANTTHTLLLKTFNEEVSQAINTGLELDRAAEQTVISMNEKFKGLINPEDPNSTVGSIAATLTEWSKATGQMVQNAGSTAVSLNSTFDNSFTSISASVNKISDAWGAADNPNSFAGRLSVQALNLVGNLQSTFNTGISAITSKIAKGDKGDGTSLEEIFSNSMLSCQNASLAFQRTVEEVARQAGIALGNAEMGGGIYGSVSSVKEIMRLLTEQTNEYSNRVTGENGALVAAQNLSTKYEIQHDKMSKLNSAMLSYNTYLTDMANKAAETVKQANALTEALNKQYEAQNKVNSQSSGVGNAGSTAAPQESHGGGDSYTPPEPPPAPEPQTYTVQKGDTLWDITGGDWNKINAIAAANGITNPNKIYTGENLIIPYDTGGYTGDWHSSQGKIAMLHEKEIVLNKADTANILDIVSMVREMTNSSLRGADGLMAGALERLASITNNSNNSRQEVYITAEFPNATSVAEIEEAFRSLPNIASQYAFSY